MSASREKKAVPSKNGLGIFLAMLTGMMSPPGQGQEVPPPASSQDASASNDLDAILGEEPPESRQEPRAEGASEAAAPDSGETASPSGPAAAASASQQQDLPTIPVPQAPIEAPQRARPSGRMIEEIVVSARKREESLQDAPVVVSALSREQLARYNVADMTKIAEMTPQLFVSNGSNGNGGTINMRGIGSSSTTSGFDQAVAINVDGIQYSRATVLHQGYFDVGQVEVLKGPQSLFFGKSSSAGVISLNTADPTPERQASIKFGNEFQASEQWAEVMLSGPVSEEFGARLAARYESTGGYIKNISPPVVDASNGETVPAPDPDWPNETQAMARLTLAYTPNSDFDAKLKLSYVDMESGGVVQGSELIKCDATGSAQLNPGQECNPDWTVHQNGLPPGVAATEPIWNHKHGEQYSFYKAQSGVATLNYAFSALKLSSVTGYYHFNHQYIADYDNTSTSVIVGAENPEERTLSQELRLLSDFDSPLNFMLGGYYQHKQFNFNHNTSRLVPLPQDPTTGRYAAFVRDSETTGKAWSVFAQLLWKLTDTIEIDGGARYSDEMKDSFSVHRYVHPLLAAEYRPAGDPLNALTHDTNLSPEVTVSWKPGDLMLYGAYKKGFKSGGYSNSALLTRNTKVEDQTFRPETVGGFEVGLKSSWLEGSLQWNVAAYSYEFKDLQVNFFDAANLNFLTQNAATATTRGVETELRWLPPIDGLELHGTASYNRAVYGKFLSFCYTGQSYEDGCNLDANGQPAATSGDHADLGGTVRPIAPEFTASLGAFYRFNLVGNLMLSVGADGSYVDRYLLSSVGRDFYQPGFFRTDANLSLGPQSGQWEIALIGRNLSNAYIAYDGGDQPLSGQGTGQHEPANVLADQYAVLGRPRELAVQFTMKFGEY